MSNKNKKKTSLDESLDEFLFASKDNYPYQGYNALKEFEIDEQEEMRKQINEKKTSSIFEEYEYQEDYKKAYAGYGSITEPSEVILRIKGEDGFSDVLSLSNISTVTGKPKSKKSMFILLIINWFAAQNKNNNYTEVADTFKKLILVFDTEQSKDIVEKVPYKIAELTNLEKALIVVPYSIRCFSPEKKLKFIIETIKRNPDTLLVVIDGIRDLIYDINNITESTNIVTELMNLASNNKIHIINVIHQNKSDNNARGNLGSELNFKSEIIISVTKKTDKISTVSCTMTRKKAFNSLQFEVGPNGLPYLIENNSATAKKETPKLFRCNEYDDKFHKNFLDGIFKGAEITGHRNLIELIGSALKNLGYELNKSTANNVLRIYINNGLVKNKGGKKNSIYYL